ncbi:MAG: FmdB family zinc ribbon protein [Actinomycetes bacterium]|jgi:putative FmdB family regulatory protein|nr:FmdB family transcriptional regulator [Acidimicrobiia bacterium]
MPTYEYQCKDCGERLEVFQKFSDKPLSVHPECGGKLQKVFHASGIVFKGSGYYVTDSRSGGRKSDSSSDKSSDD